MAFIYKIENDINDKLYVGKTEFSLEHRFAEHCRDAFHPQREARPLYRAMRKYGTDRFHISLLEETDKPEEREMYWINELGTYLNGYNATMGGDGKRSIDYDEVVRAYQAIGCQKMVAEALGICIDTVRCALSARGAEWLTSADINTERYGKAVDMYSRDGEFLQGFETIAAAVAYIAQNTGKDARSITHSHISDACKGRRKTAYGYSWRFQNANSINTYNRAERAVNMYSMSGDFLMSFESMGKAAAYIAQMTGIVRNTGMKSHIADVCRGIARSAYGYIWKFKEAGDSLAS